MIPSLPIWSPRFWIVPGPIECRLRPSRLALFLTYAPIGGLVLLAFAAGVPLVWLGPMALVTTFSLWRLKLGTEPWVYLRWHAARLTLFHGPTPTEAETFAWTGRGRRNAWYLRMELESDDGRYTLMIWRDSVTDASWRALNACYRVQATLLDVPEAP